MQGLGDFLLSWIQAIKDFFVVMPKDILCLGTIIGFFGASTGWQKNRLRIPTIIYKICNLSSIIAIVGMLCMGVYILVYISAVNMVYYIAAVIFGVIICKIVHMIFNIIGIIGSVMDVIFNVISGPVIIFVAWLFYQHQLLTFLKQ